MNLLWPGFLALLGAIPLIVAGYLWALRRRRRFAVRYSSLSLVRAALEGQSRLRRHLPFALFLLALISLIGALVRPVAVVQVPTNQTSILLAIDVSRSMCATDIQPSRIAAAKAAALRFIERQEPGTQIGVVAFARFAEVVQPPTSDQDALRTAIANLTTGRGTAIGEGILTSLDAIALINQRVAPREPTPGTETLDAPPAGQSGPRSPADAYAPEIIVVLTDGVSIDGIPPLDAAQQAADRGVRIFTIGFGSEDGGSGQDCGGGGFGGFGGGGGGGRFRRGIDEATLEAVAEMTGGDYYTATSAGELEDVFEDLPRHFITRSETLEISVIFTAIGALLAALAVGLSLRWHPLP